MGSERAAAKLPEGMVSLVLTSQKACNNEPLGIGKKEKHKLQEAKCSAFGHVSLCRMCAGISFNSFLLHHWKGEADLMCPPVQPVLYFLYWNLRNLAESLIFQGAEGDFNLLRKKTWATWVASLVYRVVLFWDTVWKPGATHQLGQLNPPSHYIFILKMEAIMQNRS